MTDFNWVMEALRGWPTSTPGEAPSTGCHRRIADVLAILRQNPESVGPRDLTGLVRQALRREGVRHHSDPIVEVPATPTWPRRTEWGAAGCGVTASSGSRYVIRALPWRPRWLPGAVDRVPAEEEAFAEGIRRYAEPLPGDGFLSVLGLTSYSAPGQRQAVRAVLASEPGATVLVSLPTGTGKSLVAHLPAVLWGASAGVSVVVVPTTALALDQERSLLSYPALPDGIPDRLAYHEGLDEAGRQAMRSAIRAGTQRIVFTSPESLAGSLAPAFFHAAQAGLLRLFAIDEAHIVSQWGAEFRPEFQAIAGMRRALLRAARNAGAEAFRTLLLTATLTEDSLDTLYTLFGDPGPFEHVSAVSLRPEPSFWLARSDDEAERRQRLLEAVGHLPRPLVVYVGTTAQVDAYHDLLVLHGHRRIARVYGPTSAEDRLAVIRQWRGEARDDEGVPRTKVDLVVATSAFGLGVDQADVRSVVHACIPETIDRFYQEVGRGGRDGRACISLVLWTDRDRAVARRLNRRRIIGLQRGFDRWEAMFARKEWLDPSRNLLRVSLDARPAHVTDGSDENRAWNVRTLTLMSRARLIELEARPPPTRAPGEAEEAWETRCEAAFAEYRHGSVIRLLDLSVSDRGAWELRCREARRRVQVFDRVQFDTMLGILVGEPALCEVFQRAYQIAWNCPESGREVLVSPERSCGGCPACRHYGRAAVAGINPSPPPLRSPHAHLEPPLASATAGVGTLWAFSPSGWDDNAWFRGVTRLIERAVRQGIKNIVADPDILAERAVRDSFRHARRRYVFLNAPEDHFNMPELPTLWIQPNQPRLRVPRDVIGRGRPGSPWIIVASEDALDPEHRTACAAQLRTPQLPLQKLIERL